MHRTCLFICLLLLAACNTEKKPETTQTAEAAPPNILLIMADDMGYSDLGCYGSEIATPNLDKLANNGIRFRNFYNAARCCPTRASLLTGLYPHEAGMGGMVSSVDANPESGPYQGFLNNNCVTIAEVLKESGYSTYMSGKWHVGEKPEYWPTKRGFDRYFGLISGGSSYYEIIKDQPRVRQMALDGQPWDPPAEGFYLTDAISDFAVSFLDEHFTTKEEKQPFFMYLAYTAPHWPLHALREDIQKYEGKYDEGWEALRQKRYEKMMASGLLDSTYQLSPQTVGIPQWEDVGNQDEWARRMEVYAAMVDRMDQGIGKVVGTLEEYGADENTLIVFLSDNGGSDENITGRKLNNPDVPIGERGSYVAYREPWANVSNTPYRRYKKWTHEGGIATPFIMHWPEGTERKGALETDYAHIVDIMATCEDLAGAQYPATFGENTIRPKRGKSLRWALEGKNRTETPTLFWEHFGHKAVRQGDWKLVAAQPENQWELYNIAEDPTELNNLAANNPDKVDKLSAAYQQWAGEVGVK